MGAEERAPEQELARQRLGAADVAVGFDPHAADRFPAAVADLLLDGGKEFRLVLPDVVVELWLALGEGVVGELLHEAQGGVERAFGLAARLAERPEPGNVDVGMTGGVDVDVEWGTGFGHGRVERGTGGGHGGVEGVAKRLACVEQAEGGVEPGEQNAVCGVVLVEPDRDSESGAGDGDEVARGLVDLNDVARPHEQFGLKIAIQCPAEASPAAQRELMGLPVAPCGMEQNFLVVAITGGVGTAVDVEQRFGMAEIAGVTQR